MRLWIGMVVALSAASACSGIEPSAPIGSTPVVSATSAPTSTLPPVVECPGAGEFDEGGAIADLDGEGSDSSRIGRVSWRRSDQCETVTLEFVTFEGAPATTVPDVRIDHLESLQVIRITLDVVGTVVTDQLVETELVDSLYVVGAQGGGMFVDLHLSTPAAARARVESSPARLHIDLRPGFVAFSGRSVIGEGVVLVSPPDGAMVDPLTQFQGYARTGSDDLLFIITQGDRIVAEESRATAEDATTWEEFRTELTLPSGEVSVFIGESSPPEGNLEGITFGLRVR